MTKKKAQLVAEPFNVAVGNKILEVQLDPITVDDNFFTTLDAIIDAGDAASFYELSLIGKLDWDHDFAYSDLEGISLENLGNKIEWANLRGSNLKDTKWAGTTMKGILLEGADLTGAQGLNDDVLSEAFIDDKTILPDQLNRQKIMERHAALGLPTPPPLWADGGEREITLQGTAKIHYKM